MANEDQSIHKAARAVRAVLMNFYQATEFSIKNVYNSKSRRLLTSSSQRSTRWR